MVSNTQYKLKKNLNSLDVFVVAFGAMIGWGWVVSSGQWIQSGGVIGAVLGFALGGIMIFNIGLVYAELTTSLPQNCGVHTFSFMAFGPNVSFLCSWAMLLSYISVVCYEACSFPIIVEYIFPGLKFGYLYSVGEFDIYLSWILISVLNSIIIIGLNILGVKFAAKLQSVLTAVIAFVGLALVIASLCTGDMSNIKSQIFVGKNSVDFLKNIIQIAVITPFFFFGFDVIPQAAEEINIPLKKIGRIMMLSILMAFIFYSSIIFSVGYVMNPSDIASSINSSGLVSADAMVIAFKSEAMAKVLIFGGICGILTSWNSFMIGGSRALYALSNAKIIPKCFSHLSSRFKTPVTALLFLGLLSIISPFLGQGMLTWIMKAGNLGCCVAYLIVSISFIKLRKKYPLINRPYKVRHVAFVGGMSMILSAFMTGLYIVPSKSFSLNVYEWIIVGIWYALGLVFYYYARISYKDSFANIQINDIICSG